MRKAIIIGAGPAGLTAAYQLLKTTDIKPIIIEASNVIGGISQTANFNENRMDLGGHRFFTKVEEVEKIWLEILPLENAEVNSSNTDEVMMIRSRLSRILFLRKFYDYPISLNPKTIKNLGLWRMIKIFFSYMKVAIFRKKKIENLEDFYISRFGKVLYQMFFENYTYKVWGVPCREISADWGAQRVKGLSIRKTITHAFGSIFRIKRKKVETSLIDSFMYPKHGPGQLYEAMAKKIVEMGGEIIKNQQVTIIHNNQNTITSITAIDKDGVRHQYHGEYFISTMPVRDLVNAMTLPFQEENVAIANGLLYRDFMTVGLLLKNIQLKYKKKPVKDNWIYIQESDVKLGRIQVFNNWSPYMVNDPDTIFLGLEYFSNEGDELDVLTDEEFSNLAIEELIKLKIINREDVLDAFVIRMPKAYPAYFGTYGEFNKLRAELDTYENLYLIGRNGQHRYNNMDHSMLTAITAVENIKNNNNDKNSIWSVNTEKHYHEKK